jgi:hypothetical protein
LHPELALDLPHQVVAAHRDAARAEDHVVPQRLLDRGAVRLTGVGGRRDHGHLGTGARERRSQ